MTVFHILRAAATPLLVLSLVVGSAVGVWAIQVLVDVAEHPPEGHAAGFVGFAYMILAAVGLGVGLISVGALWLVWRRRKPPCPRD